ncbi:MAG: CdaR family protein [Deltaproteobacteria bacterium]
MTNPFRTGDPRARRSTTGEVGAWVLALLVAIGLWLSVNLAERESERTVRVRIDLMNLPAGMMITNTVPAYAQVRVRGSGLLLSSIDADRMATRLDLTGVRPGRVTYSLPASDFAFPRNVDVTRVTPSRVSLDIDAIGSREVPIRLVTRGKLKSGLELVDTIVLPDRVVLEGPESQLATVDDVPTRRVPLGELDAGVNEITIRLLRPNGKVQLRNAEVRVRLVIDRQIAERRFENVPVAIRNAKAPWQAVPNVVSFVVRGPAEELASLDLAPSAVTVDATDQQPPGPVALRPDIALPPGFDIVRVSPAEVKLGLLPGGADTFIGPRRLAAEPEAVEPPK